MEITINSELQPTIIDNSFPNYNQQYAILSVIPTEGNEEYALLDTVKSGLRNPGFMGLISMCYSYHLPLAINPHDIWIVLLSEINKNIKNNVELYRSLFSASKEKQTLLAYDHGKPSEFPIPDMISILTSKILVDINLFFPKFSTTTGVVDLTMKAMFCDMVSPYYRYTTMACGLPKIRLNGTKEDWELLLDSWVSMSNLFVELNPSISTYADTVFRILNGILKQWDNPTVGFWKSIYTQQNVGSGRQMTISGWIKDLYNPEKRGYMLEHYTKDIAVIKHTHKPSEQQFATVFGGFDFSQVDGFYELLYTKYVCARLK